VQFPDFLEIGDNLGVAGENVTAISLLFPCPPIANGNTLRVLCAPVLG